MPSRSYLETLVIAGTLAKEKVIVKIVCNELTNQIEFYLCQKFTLQIIIV